MATVTRRSILGIDISPTQIRVVEMQGRFSNAHIVRADSAPTPPGGVQGERVFAPEIVAPALRGLLDRMGVSTREAIIGLPPTTVSTRILDLPPVPDNQLRGILEGELEHYQIIREGGGAFDYMRLPLRSREEEGAQKTLLMAAENNVIHSYRMLADMAGLQLLVLEPTLLALFRMSAAQTVEQAVSVSLNLSYGGAEFVAMDGGQIRLYRRIDIGTNNLLPSRGARQNAASAPMANAPRLNLLGEFDTTPEPQESGLNAPSNVEEGINTATARILAVEMQRSLDFFRRENPQAGEAREILLTTNDPDMGDFASWLSGESGLKVVQARLAGLRNISPDALMGANSAGSGDATWMGAVSLGAGGLSEQAAGLPHFNLSSQQLADAAVAVVQQKMRVSLGASLAVAGVGLLAILLVGLRIRAANGDLERAKAELETKQQQQQVQLQQLQTQQNQLTVLRGQGFPFSRLMDAVAAQVPPQTDLSEVTLDKTGKLSLIGDALNNQSAIRMVEQLRTVKWLDAPQLDSLDRQPSTSDRAAHIQFRISAMLPAAVATTTPAR